LAIANLKYLVKFGIELEPVAGPEPKQPKLEAGVAPLRRNALPDVYPEAKTPRD
jgi:hypothetical protein